MSTELRELQRQTLSDTVMPYIRFFTARNKFFSIVDSWKELPFVECGCGSGDTVRELSARRFSVLGIDIANREGQSSNILIADASTFAFSRNMVCLICRPDHSGWCQDTMHKALKEGAIVLYVGLPKNLERDVGQYFGKHTKCHAKVGEEGESLWVFSGD